MAEAESVAAVYGENTYIKVPVNREGIKAIRELKRKGFAVTATAIYTREQAVLAGAQAVILPPAVLDAMTDNALIDNAVSDFRKDWTEINGEKRIDKVLTQ